MERTGQLRFKKGNVGRVGLQFTNVSREFVLDTAHGMPASAPRNNSVGVFCAQNLLLIGVIDAAFRSGKEARANLNAFCTQSNSSGKATAVSNASCRNNGDGNGIAHRRGKRHCSKFPDMTARLAAFSHNSVCPTALHTSSQSSRSHNRNDLASCLFPHIDVVSRIAGARGYHTNLHLCGKLSELRSLRVHQHNVQAERLVRKTASFFNLLADPRNGSRSAGNDSQAACFAYGGGKFRIGDPCHTTLDDGLFNAQQLGNTCLHIRMPHFTLRTLPHGHSCQRGRPLCKRLKEAASFDRTKEGEGHQRQCPLPNATA